MLHPPRVALLLGGVVLLAGVAFVAAAPAGAVPTRSAQDQIALAFRELRLLPSVPHGAAYLQGYDQAMRTDLEQAGTLLTSGIDKPMTVHFSAGTPVMVGSDEASVLLTITVKAKDPPPSFGDTIRAAALRVGRRWKVSWTTMCLLVESSHQLCPPTPKHLEPGQVVPTAGPEVGVAAAAPRTIAPTPGLVGPGPLAMAPDGGVLIADSDRDQILEWHNGMLSVVAGDGLDGFTGDGGPAIDAELDGPGPMAVAPDGTIYFVDRGNNRVRAVAPDGTMRTVAGNGTLGLGPATTGEVVEGQPATSEPLQPSGIAVSPSGVLYVASNSAIYDVRSGILSTVVAGGPPAGVDVTIGGVPTAFFPTDIAFNGQGNLVVFSFSPKELFSVDPANGQVTPIGPSYANAMAPAPDGTVLIAAHSGAPERVSNNTVTALPLTDPLRGPSYAMVADGIAEAANGTVYVDTESGDGSNEQADLYAVTGGSVQPVPVVTPELASLPTPGAPGFPASIFPLSTPARGSSPALPSCPSLAGVVPFTPSAEATARQLLGDWNTDFSYNLHASDRSWWAGLIASYTGGRQTVGAVTPAVSTLYAPAIAAACGKELVDDSIAVVMAASEYSSSYEHLYLLDRNGTPLVYFSAS